MLLSLFIHSFICSKDHVSGKFRDAWTISVPEHDADEVAKDAAVLPHGDVLDDPQGAEDHPQDGQDLAAGLHIVAAATGRQAEAHRGRKLEKSEWRDWELRSLSE